MSRGATRPVPWHHKLRSMLARSQPGQGMGTLALLVLAYGIILIARLALTLRPPINSTDLMRYIGFGWEFWRYGLSIYDYAPRDFVGAPYADLWPKLQYIYPAYSMLFFAAIARIWPSLFFARLALTLLELASSVLVAKLTRSRLFGLLYFFSPVSVWWISGEGQMEALVSLFTLLALWTLARGGRWSYFWLAVSIQTKYWPGVLLPHFLSTQRRLRPLALALLTFIPSILFAAFSDYVFHILFSGNMASNCNPFTWNFLDGRRTCGTPLWHTGIYAGATYGMLAILLIGAALDRHDTKRLLAYVAPLAFLIYYKSVTWATAWYLVVLPVFAVPIERRWVRWAILLLSFAEPIAIAGLLGSPIGWIHPNPPAQYLWGGIMR